LVDADSLQSSLQHLPLHPLAGLSLFLTEKHQSLAVNPFKSDPTVQRLYSIAKHIFENQIAVNDSTIEECLNVCQHANDRIEQRLVYLRANVLDTDARNRTENQLMAASSTLLAFQNKHRSSSSVSSPSLLPSSFSPSPFTSTPPPLDDAQQQEPHLYNSTEETHEQPSSQDDQWIFIRNYVAFSLRARK
jgi:hypothetical protein